MIVFSASLISISLIIVARNGLIFVNISLAVIISESVRIALIERSILAIRIAKNSFMSINIVTEF